MDISVDVTGTAELNRKLRRLSDLVVHLSGEKVIGSCRRIVATAKELVPVRTGELQRALTYSTEGTRGWVGVRMASPARVYWRFVEFGTVRYPAHPYFRPAAEAERSRFEAAMREIGSSLEAA